MCTEPSPEELTKYRNAVQLFFELKTKKAISNSMPDHAAILLEQFFLHAKSSMRILCKHLSRAVYDKEFLIEAACGALKRGVDIEIIMQEKDPQATKFAHAFCEHGGELFYSTDGSVVNAKLNFAVMDRQAVRVEHCNDRCEAVASIQDDIADVLCSVFQQLKAKGIQPLHV